MDKSSYRYSILLYSRYVIWYQTIVLTGVFLCCWPALVTFASFCLVVFCFVLLYSFTISCAYGCCSCSWYLLETGLINLKATTVSIFHSTNITHTDDQVWIPYVQTAFTWQVEHIAMLSPISKCPWSLTLNELSIIPCARIYASELNIHILHKRNHYYYHHHLHHQQFL